jgi:hypothetical protein
MKNMQALKLSIKSPSLSPPNTYPFFEWYPQNKEILLNLSMKCWYSAFNAQGGSRVTIIVVQVGAVENICSRSESAQDRGDETQFTTKIGGKTSFGSQLFRFVKFRSQLCIWCPTMPKLAVLAP